VEDWLRQLRATAEDAEDAEEPEAASGTPQPAVVELGDHAENAQPQDGPALERTQVVALPAQRQVASPPEPESLEDWEDGFAVSSAEHAERAE
jgi:hypothetical protein